LVDDKAGWRRVIEELKQEKVVGFDTEAKPEFSTSSKTNERKTSPHLIQFSTRKTAYLLSTLNVFENKTEMADLLSQVLTNKAIVKVGFALRQDKETLSNNYGVKLTEAVDLAVELSTRKLVCSLVSAVQEYLHEPYQKRKRITMSNWAQPLSNYSQEMIEYAANDAYLALLVYDAWIRNGKVVLPIPSHEAHHELMLQQREAKQKAREEGERKRNEAAGVVATDETVTKANGATR
jgi:ribonuclease D